MARLPESGWYTSASGRCCDWRDSISTLGHGVRLHADMIAATWPGRLRLAVRAATLAGPAGVRVSSPATAWDMAGIFGEDLRLTLVGPQAGLSIRKLAYPVGSAWNIEARGLDVGRLLDVRRDAHPLLDGGIADGRVDLQASTDALRFHVDMGARGARLGALADNAADEPQLGDPTDVTLRFDGAGAGSGARSRSPRSTRPWPVPPCRARSHCAISTPIRLSISHSACSIWTSRNCWVHPGSRCPKA